MKKNSKPRLVLRRETISVLSIEEMLQAQGGRSTNSQTLSTGPSFGCPPTGNGACPAIIGG